MRLCSIEVNWTSESPSRTCRLTMSISSPPSAIVGTIGRSVPVARRVSTMHRASSSSGEKGRVSMSSTPRSNALSFVLRSPLRVSPRTGVMVRVRAFEVPTSWRKAALSWWSMSTTAKIGRHSARTARAAARSDAVRRTKRPWLRVSLMRSTTNGRSWSTSARRASSGSTATRPDYLPHRSCERAIDPVRSKVRCTMSEAVVPRRLTSAGRRG